MLGLGISRLRPLKTLGDHVSKLEAEFNKINDAKASGEHDGYSATPAGCT